MGGVQHVRTRSTSLLRTCCTLLDLPTMAVLRQPVASKRTKTFTVNADSTSVHSVPSTDNVKLPCAFVRLLSRPRYNFPPLPRRTPHDTSMTPRRQGNVSMHCFCRSRKTFSATFPTKHQAVYWHIARIAPLLRNIETAESLHRLNSLPQAPHRIDRTSFRRI